MSMPILVATNDLPTLQLVVRLAEAMDMETLGNPVENLEVLILSDELTRVARLCSFAEADSGHFIRVVPLERVPARFQGAPAT
jgi:hypothetical protein